VNAKNSRPITAKPGKTLKFPHITDGAREPAYLPARPIAPGTHALKFFPPGFFWIESSRAEKNPARNLKNRKFFRSKVENSKKSWRESWKKRCQFGN
jgi:hypothetical protein